MASRQFGDGQGQWSPETTKVTIFESYEDDPQRSRTSSAMPYKWWTKMG